jgi:glyoxylase-like metal-dependent hydrolase (beta-lactamase superfamily II)
MQLEVVQLNEHIAYIDNGLLNAPGFGSTYLVRGDELAIVETGTSRSAPAVLDGLRRLGVAPAEVRHILLTHIHMDHAGGTGTLLPHMPDAQVYIHSRTAQFLIEPASLLASAARALGPLFEQHGTVEPVSAERIVHADELRLDLGRDVVMTAVATPGHSPDHLAFYEASSRCLFTGDGVGVVIPAVDYRGPMTPPPAVNIGAQRETFERLLALDCDTLLFSHYGPCQEAPRQVLGHQHEQFERFVTLMREQWTAGNIDREAILRMIRGEQKANSWPQTVHERLDRNEH